MIINFIYETQYPILCALLSSFLIIYGTGEFHAFRLKRTNINEGLDNPCYLELGQIGDDVIFYHKWDGFYFIKVELGITLPPKLNLFVSSVTESSIFTNMLKV